MPFEARNSGLIKVEFSARNSSYSTVCTPIVHLWVLQRVMGSAREGTMDGMEWRPIWSWLAGLQRGKKLECGKEVSPRNHSSPCNAPPLLFLPYSPAFLTYFSCMANDRWRRGNQMEDTRKTWGKVRQW